MGIENTLSISLFSLLLSVTVSMSISAFASLVGILVGFTSSAVGLKMCALFTGIKKHKSVIMKKRKKHDQIVLLAKSKVKYIRSFYFQNLKGTPMQI